MIGSMVVYAAMTVKEEKVNQFQIGNFQTEISEVFTEPTTIVAGQSVKKEVRITNTGTINQFVRVMLFPEIKKQRTEGHQLLPVVIGNELVLDLDTVNWLVGEDGYYYYLDSVKPGKDATTSALFTKLTLKSGLDSSYKEAKVSLLVKVEAINCTAESYREAWWQGMSPTTSNLKKIDTALAKKVEN